MAYQPLLGLSVFLLTLCCNRPVHAVLPTEGGCVPVEWVADRNNFPENFATEEPFQNPGEVTEGVLVRDLLQLTGLAWNAQSWQEIVGLFCISYGPALNELLGNNEIMEDCEPILSALRSNRDSSIYDTCIDVSTETGVGDLSSTSLDMFTTGDQDIDELLTVTNLSPIIFELLDWLGPSPFSLDIHGACSALRIMLSMPLEDIINRVKNLRVYLLTIFLESSVASGACENPMPGSDESSVVAILDDLSGSNDLPLCQFLAGNPSHEDVVERASTIIDNAEAFLTDTIFCRVVLTTLDENIRSTDNETRGAFNAITGTTLNSTSSREQLCSDIAMSFSSDSSYVPTLYTLPEGETLGEFQFGETPGEILPGFFFRDALDVAGAFRRSPTLANGISVLCDVFEQLLKDSYPEIASDISKACESLRSMEFAEIEDACLDALRSETLGDTTVPTSLRPFTVYYLGAIGLEYYRLLVDPTRLSPEDTCSDLNRYFLSENNLGTATRLAVDVWLQEVIPIVHGICEDYGEVYAFYEDRYCCGDFSEVETAVRELILAHLGFQSKENVCREIASGVNGDDGRAGDEVVEDFQSEVLRFLTDERRCVASATAVLQGVKLSDRDLTDRDLKTMFNKYSGYDTVESACKELREFFSTSICGVTGGTAVLRPPHYSMLAFILLAIVIMLVQ